MTLLEGIDFSSARPAPAAILAAGKRFVVRYVPVPVDPDKPDLGWLIHPKYMSAAEAATYRAAGLPIALVYETDAQRALLGAPAGRIDGAAAIQGSVLVGQPQDRPIYFAVDWDASPLMYPAIDAYLTAAAAVIGADRVGVYAGLRVIQHCQAAGTARWFWQTYAWSGGAVAPGIHLYQWQNDQRIGGGAVDYTRALTDDYGQWPAPAGGDKMAALKGTGTPIGTFTFTGPPHALIDTSDTTRHIRDWPGGGLTFDVIASIDLKTRDGRPIDIEGTSPPLANRDQVWLVDRPAFGAAVYVLRGDGTFTPAATFTQADIDVAATNARKNGYNAGRVAVIDAAGKVPPV